MKHIISIASNGRNAITVMDYDRNSGRYTFTLGEVDTDAWYSITLYGLEFLLSFSDQGLVDCWMNMSTMRVDYPSVVEGMNIIFLPCETVGDSQ